MHTIKEYLSYDPLTGIFTRLKGVPGNHGSSGSVAGWKDKDGYVCLRRKTKIYKAHRLAWYYMYGELPKVKIDHINGHTADNRICNLRLATDKQNSQNRNKPNKSGNSGYMGVSKIVGSARWRAVICINRKQIYLGAYATPEEASGAYLAAKRKHHPFWVE
jgi:hypothetical protein